MPRLLLLAFAGFGLCFLSADPPTSDQTKTDQAALTTLQDLVGKWKGVGQPQRGSNKGAWSEQADWKWQFEKGRAALRMDGAETKYWTSTTLQPAKQQGEFELLATLPDGKTTERFQGQRQADGKLILTAKDAAAGRPARVTISVVAEGARLTLLAEQSVGEGRYARLAEIGYTRDGSDFGKGGGGPECVVTGGKGTMPIEYKGHTYYVCCTGCRDAFKETPEKILKEYQERKAAELSGKK